MPFYTRQLPAMAEIYMFGVVGLCLYALICGYRDRWDSYWIGAAVFLLCPLLWRIALGVLEDGWLQHLSSAFVFIHAVMSYFIILMVWPLVLVGGMIEHWSLRLRGRWGK